MGEPCKKKPRKSKLVAGTYVDLPEEEEPVQQNTPPQGMQISVNVEVEECDEDWLTKMVEDEKAKELPVWKKPQPVTFQFRGRTQKKRKTKLKAVKSVKSTNLKRKCERILKFKTETITDATKDYLSSAQDSASMSWTSSQLMEDAVKSVKSSKAEPILKIKSETVTKEDSSSTQDSPSMSWTSSEIMQDEAATSSASNQAMVTIKTEKEDGNQTETNTNNVSVDPFPSMTMEHLLTNDNGTNHLIKTVVEDGIPTFKIEKVVGPVEETTEEQTDVLQDKPVTLKGKKTRAKRVPKEKTEPHQEMQVPFSEDYFVAVDTTVKLKDAKNSNAYYRALLDLAVQMSPLTALEDCASRQRVAEEVAWWTCDDCEEDWTSLKGLERHLEVRHSKEDKNTFVYVEPNNVLVTSQPPARAPFLADLNTRHIAHYCASYAGAAWALVARWSQAAARDPFRKPRGLGYKCYPCRSHYPHYSEFAEHLEAQHAARRLLLAAELLPGGYLGIHACDSTGPPPPTSLLRIPRGLRCPRCSKLHTSLKLLELHQKRLVLCAGCGRPHHCNELAAHEGFCEARALLYFPKTCACRKTFDTARDLASHQRSMCKETSTLAYRCVVCRHVAPTYYVLFQHQCDEHHARSDVFALGAKVRSCVTCGGNFVGSSDLHHCPGAPDTIACNLCGFTFRTKQLLEVHWAVMRGDKKCNKCAYRIAKCKMIYHTIMHHETLYKIVLKCPDCKAVYEDGAGRKCAGKCKNMLSKMCVFKDPESVIVYKNSTESEPGQHLNIALLNCLKQPKLVDQLALQEEMAASSRILLPKLPQAKLKRPRSAPVKDSFLKVYAGPLPEVIKKAIKEEKLMGPSGDPEKRPLVVKVQALGASKAFEKSSERSLLIKNYSVKANASRSLLKKVVDKIVFEDDEGDVTKKAEEKSMVIDVTDAVAAKQKADANFKKTFNDQRQTIMIRKLKTVASDSKPASSEKSFVIFRLPSNESKDNTCDNKSDSDVVCSVKDGDEKTDVLESSIIPKDDVEKLTDTSNTTSSLEEGESSVTIKKEIEDTENATELENGLKIKEEMVELISHLKTENPSEGCSYATEVSVENVIEETENSNTDEITIKDEPIEYDGGSNNAESQEKTEKKTISEEPCTSAEQAMPFKCTKCSFTGMLNEYNAHKKLCAGHVGKPTLTYKCSQCDLECLDLRDYLKHLPQHGFKKFQCPACQELLVNNQKLAEHVLQHIKADFRKITYIDKTAKDQAKKFRCNHCREVFSQTEFFTHWQGHFDKQPKQEEAKEDMLALSKTVLAEVLQVLQSPKKIKKRNCSICNHLFMRINDLKRHYIEHLLTHAYTQKTVNKKLRCQICGELFDKAVYYKKHMRDHALLPLYQCQICDKAFSDSSNFGKHKKVHNLYVFVCDICSKKFQCKVMLERHLQAHQGSEPLQCGQCRRVFYFATALRRHQRSAHATPSFCCKLCRERFRSLKEKWVHDWEVHKERKFEGDCPICGASFRNFADTKTHLRRAHGLVAGNKELVKLVANLDKYKVTVEEVADLVKNKN